MEIDLDTGKLVVFVAGLVVFLGIEAVWPARALGESRWRRYGFHAGVAVINTVVIRLLVFVPFLLWVVHVEEQGWGISRWLGLVGWTEIVLSIVVLDAFDYLWHRANHRIPLLWRFHKAHHADPDMDVSTALRFHPGELILSGLAKAAWVAVWGPTAVAWFAFEALVSLCAQFHHGNFDLPDAVERRLARVLVTPRFHARHHLVDRRFGDRNFSTILSIWDPLFGSAISRDLADAPVDGTAPIGLPEGREVAFSPLAWLLEPFAGRNVSLARRPGADA